jgi:hypothetical protein
MFKVISIVIVYSILLNLPGIAQSIGTNNLTEVAASFGLRFEKEVEYRSEDSAYTENIQLLNLSKKAHAMQFRLLINKAPDDSPVLIFSDIQKGADLSEPSWLMDYNIIKGPVTKNGASQDEIFIVLYNLNQNGGLLPGDYKNLFTVKYKVAELSGLKNNIKSSIQISNAEASTFDGFAIDIKSDRNEFKIYISRK